jgi:metallo-beta-lactamase family protein
VPGDPLPVSYHLRHLGGENTVTGSCHLLQVNGVNILVDCGLAQGGDQARALCDWPISPRELDYLFLTHAHLDHVGRLPELLQAGFTGEIIVSLGTRTLLDPMLADAMALNGIAAEERRQLLAAIDRQARAFENGRDFELRQGVRFRLGRAGHILGSSFIRLAWEEPAPFSILFSGDLGARHTPLLPDPDPPPACDLLVLESTYGDRRHEDRSQRVQRLGNLLARALADRGKVFIPAFALGRT